MTAPGPAFFAVSLAFPKSLSEAASDVFSSVVAVTLVLSFDPLVTVSGLLVAALKLGLLVATLELGLLVAALELGLLVAALELGLLIAALKLGLLVAVSGSLVSSLDRVVTVVPLPIE